MTTIQQHHQPHKSRFTRRAALHVGQLSALGLGLSRLASMAAASAHRRPVARNCILVWLDGGPSHLETFDLKPSAAAEVRGPLQPIATAVGGISISECLPQLATRMQDIALIRSMTSPLGEHNLGAHYLLTGYQPTPVLEYPSFQTVANQQSSTAPAVLPNNIAVPEYRVGGAGFSGSGFLPPEFGPFSIGADPAQPGFQVSSLTLPAELTGERIQQRRRFAEQLAAWHDTPASAGLNAAQAQAFQMVTSREARSAFRLDEESDETRRRYGAKTVGQSCLLARRLVERGVRFVTVNQRGWDTHENLYTRLKEGYTGAKVGVGLIPSLDLAVSALIDDLKRDGLLQETLIVIMGEFGRTPKINTLGGRDHWPRVFSVALAGGGIKGGQVIGASDAVGESPADHPVTPADLICTIYTLLGLDPRAELTTGDGRPVRLIHDDARVVQELLT